MPVKIITDEPIDIVAKDDLQVEIQLEVGFEHKFKLYIHDNGQTIVRIGKLTSDHFVIDRNTVKMLLLRTQ